MDISQRKKRTPIIEDSSSSGEDNSQNDKENTDEELQTTSASKVTPRSSERIQQKRNRKFSMPSKEDLWEKITPSKSPGKIDQYRPRKLVNNFTKENSRYNYDPNETSGDESMDDFLVDDNDVDVNDSSGDSDSKSSKKNVKKTPRIKGRHNRLRTLSQLEESSSSENDVEHDDNDDGANCNRLNRDLNVANKLRDNKAAMIDSDSVSDENQNDDNNSNNDGDDDEDNVSDENNGLKLTSRGKRNRSLIESDNDDDDGVDDESDGDVRHRKKQNRSIIESDSEETVESVMEDIKPDLGVRIKIEPDTDKDYLESVKHNFAHNGTDGSATSHDIHIGTYVPINEIKKEICAGTSRSVDNEVIARNADTNTIKKEVETSDDDDETDDECSRNGSDTESGSDDNSSDSDEDIVENTRVRVRKLKKKRRNEKLFSKFREERKRKLAKLKSQSCSDSM